jgi:hypothetical protein
LGRPWRKTSLACCGDQTWKEARRFPDRQVSAEEAEKAEVEALMAESNPSKTNPDKELQVIFSTHDDWRRVIAAGKVQRWDVVKWGVTVNAALAALAATVTIPLRGAVGLFVIAVVVALMSWRLMSHYNNKGARRCEKARRSEKRNTTSIMTASQMSMWRLIMWAPIATGRSCKCLRAL